MKQKVFLLAAIMMMTAAFTRHAAAQNQPANVVVNSNDTVFGTVSGSRSCDSARAFHIVETHRNASP